MRNYYENKETGESAVVYERISNGTILTSFTSNGAAISNRGEQKFVSDQELEENWKPFRFRAEVNKEKEVRKATTKFVRSLHDHLNNHGAFENGAQEFNSVEWNCQIVETILFDYNGHPALDDLISEAIKQEFPEEVADDLIFSEVGDFYGLVYSMRNDLVLMANAISAQDK